MSAPAAAGADPAAITCDLPLHELQRQLQSYILGGAVAPGHLVATTPRAGSDERLAVYANAYRLRLSAALEVDYPALRTLLGAQEFDVLAGAYVDACPSGHYSVRWFGRQLGDFLATVPPWQASPALAQLARLEWALGEAFDAADAVPIDPGQLSALHPEQWPGLRVRFHPSLRVVDVDCDIMSAWQALSTGRTAAIEPLARRVTLIVWRARQRNCFRSLADPEVAIMSMLRNGDTFAATCAALAEATAGGDVAQIFAGSLRRWIDEGLIAAIESAADPA